MLPEEPAASTGAFPGTARHPFLSPSDPTVSPRLQSERVGKPSPGTSVSFSRCPPGEGGARRYQPSPPRSLLPLSGGAEASKAPVRRAGLGQGRDPGGERGAGSEPVRCSIAGDDRAPSDSLPRWESR